MKKDKRVVRKKTIGFALSWILILLSVVTAGLYFMAYGQSEMMSWGTVIALVAGAGVAFLLMLFKGAKFAYIPLIIGITIAMLTFLSASFDYLTVVLFGVGAEMDFEFLLCAGLLGISLLLSCVNYFIPQEKVVQTKIN